MSPVNDPLTKAFQDFKTYLEGIGYEMLTPTANTTTGNWHIEVRRPYDPKVFKVGDFVQVVRLEDNWDASVWLGCVGRVVEPIVSTVNNWPWVQIDNPPETYKKIGPMMFNPEALVLINRL